MTGVFQDIRFGLRQLRTSFGFTSVAVIAAVRVKDMMRCMA
ncbi:MAG TPA: hypothetical protein VJP02_00230 [Candidatus Sulfotelmatobacter sp.]|nr:hypothetical protein [Candidatus Sulfotelmatobacter sp.]